MNNRQYRVAHELGSQFAVPAYFDTHEEAREFVERQRAFTRKISSETISEGWRIEFRVVTQWEKVQA